MKKFKLNIYFRNGDFDHEEYFETINELNARYSDFTDESWRYRRPTAWKKMGSNWERLLGY